MDWLADHSGFYSRLASAARSQAVRPFTHVARQDLSSAALPLAPTSASTFEQRVTEASEQRIRMLQTRTVGWIAVAGLMLRTVALPISAAMVPGLVASLSPASTAVIVAVSLGNLALTILSATSRLADKWNSQIFFTADLAATVTLTVWAAFLVPASVLLGPDRDVMVLYSLSTVAVWTSIRGWRLSAALVLGGTALNLVLAAIRGSAVSITAAFQLAGRTGWLAAGLAVSLVIMLYARRTARLGDASGVKFGQAVEQAEALRELHDTALQAFGQVTQRSSGKRTPMSQRLASIRALAAQKLVELRIALVGLDLDTHPEDLDANLRLLAEAFSAQGLTVQMRGGALKSQPPDLATHAILGAVREALNNVAKHAGVSNATVAVTSRTSMVTVMIEDHGAGFRWMLMARATASETRSASESRT